MNIIEIDRKIQETKELLSDLQCQREHAINNGIRMLSTRTFNLIEQAVLNAQVPVETCLSISSFIEQYRILKLDLPRASGKTEACLRYIGSVGNAILVTPNALMKRFAQERSKQNQYQMYTLQEYTEICYSCVRSFGETQVVIFDEVKFDKELVDMWYMQKDYRHCVFVFIGTGIV